MRRQHRFAPAGAAFTLVELLVSITILVSLVAFISQMMSSVSSVTTQSGKRMDSDSQARTIFDRMTSDFASMVRRQDVDYIFAKQGGNDTMYFFSEAPAYFDSTIGAGAKSTVSLVGYRINASFQLERLSRGLTWDGTSFPSPAPGGMVFLTPSGSTTPLASSTIAGVWSSVVGSAPGYSDGTGSDYHVLGDQVYRLEISFLQTDGTVKSAVNSYDGLQNVAAVVVALGMLDTTSRVVISQNAPIPLATGTRMVGALPDSADGASTLERWKATPYPTNSGIPQTAAAQLRVYERMFYLNKK